MLRWNKKKKKRRRSIFTLHEYKALKYAVFVCLFACFYCQLQYVVSRDSHSEWTNIRQSHTRLKRTEHMDLHEFTRKGRLMTKREKYDRNDNNPGSLMQGETPEGKTSKTGSDYDLKPRYWIFVFVYIRVLDISPWNSPLKCMVFYCCVGTQLLSSNVHPDCKHAWREHKLCSLEFCIQTMPGMGGCTFN